MGTTDSSKAGFTVEAGLPNIYGTFAGIARWDFGDNPASGAFSGVSGRGPEGNYNGNSMKYTFNAASYNRIYGNSTTVQPPAYYVYIWKRVS